VSEKAQIVHSNGAKDTVAIMATSAVVKLLVVFIMVTLGSVGLVGTLMWRVGHIEDRLDMLVEKIDAGMDSRWRRSDQDAYALEIDRRLRILETRPFPFTERKDELLGKTAYAVEDLLRRLSECEAKIKEHESGKRHEDK